MSWRLPLPWRPRRRLGVMVGVRNGCYSVYSFIVVVRVHTYHIIVVVVAEDYTPVSQSVSQAYLTEIIVWDTECTVTQTQAHTGRHTTKLN